MNPAKNLTMYLGGILLVGATAGGVGMLMHSRSRAEAHEAKARQEEVAAGPVVMVATATRGPSERQLQLQAEARPFAEVTLYAKISGYLKTIAVDKGDRVRKDQLLAVIESPELDRQYDAAVADATYKRKNAGRTSTLASSGLVATRDAELDTSQSMIADATAAGLNTQLSYKQLRAPFDGTVTARFADPGALVQSAVNAQTSALPVVTVADLDRLRVYAYIDQREAALVHLSDGVQLTAPDGTERTGKVTRLAGELDARTRTMLVEVDLDNRDHSIVPGSFVTVSLTLKLPPAVQIPAEALVVRGKQTLVAAVTADNRIQFRPVGYLSNDGTHALLNSGIAVGESVALNLGDRVVDGARVQPANAAVPPGPQKS